MSNVGFYDDDWRRLLKRHPLIARKIEELRCEAVGYKEFEELRKRVERLEKMGSPVNLKVVASTKQPRARAQEVKDCGENIRS